MKNIPLAKPDIHQDDILAVINVLKSGMLVQGSEVLKLEKKLCEFNNALYSKALSNGTATMHLALKCLNIGPGDEVIVPAFSYAATANVVELVGARPIFVDIELNSLNINPELIEKKITNNTKAIIPVHEFGYPADMDAINEIAKKHTLYVIEDAACALGSKYKGKYVGTFSDFGSFSFHPRKSITSGEGGCLLMSNEDYSKKIEILRNHGFDSEKNSFVEAGFNYRMTDFQAAMLNSQMERFSNTLSHKKTLARLYSSLLKDHESILFTKEKEGYEHSWQTFHIIIDSKIDRDKIISILKKQGIGWNYGAQCIPSLKFYNKKYNLDCKSLFPNAMMAYNQGVALPLFYSITEHEIKHITTTLKNILKYEK